VVVAHLAVVLAGAAATGAAGSERGVHTLWETAGSPGVVVEGGDHGLWRMPPEAVVADYANDGYRLQVREGWVEVEVEVAPLRSAHPFELPPEDPLADGLAVLARHVAAGADSRYAAVSRVLSWVARGIRYELDRDASQQPEQVLDRRTAYCTGIARLSVALLDRLGIEAREVSGYVFGGNVPRGDLLGEQAAGEGGYHRWIEVLYPDRGWVFSDPLHSHHFVPANYVRLDSERLDLGRVGPAEEGLARDRRLPARDLYPYGPPWVLARSNGGPRIAAALRVELDPPSGATLTLSSGRVSRSTRVAGEPSTFVGLQPGSYRLVVAPLDGGSAITRPVQVLDRVRTDLVLRLPRTELLWRQPAPASGLLESARRLQR
jgi:hypothetical protein